MTRVISIDEKNQWVSYVNEAVTYDFYHTWTYNSLDNSGDPFLFVYEENGVFVAFPLIKRKIENTPYYDLTSVYGYSGPIANLEFEKLDKTFVRAFQDAFLEFLREENFISVFSRFNPFLNQPVLIRDVGGLYDNGKTVAIDLTGTYKEQTSAYRRAFWGSIKKLRKLGYYVKESSSLPDLHSFISIYYQNMDRIGACDYYYFNEPYFLSLLNGKEYNAKLLLVCLNGEPVSAGIFTASKGIAQAHLLATRTEYLSISPAKLLIDEAAISARGLKAKYLHLGGGLGFREDSLFHWKCGFSDITLPYVSWRFIVNQPVYDSLVRPLGLEDPESIDFFPLYRYKVPNAVLVVEEQAEV